MTREELTFSSDELGEIFGSAAVTKKEEPKKAEPKPDDMAAPAVKAKSLVVQNKFAELESIAAKPVKIETKTLKPEKAQADVLDTDVDELMKRAGEIERAMRKEAPPAVVVAGEIEPARVMEMFEEIRKAAIFELESKSGRKPLENMMLRTLEKTAAEHTVLKNTNWDKDGNLRLNGTIDMERLLKNLGICQDKNTADETLAKALSALLYLRLFSVKQGLGAEVYITLREKLVKKAVVIEAGYGAGTAHYFKNNILNPAIAKGDELK